MVGHCVVFIWQQLYSEQSRGQHSFLRAVSLYCEVIRAEPDDSSDDLCYTTSRVSEAVFGAGLPFDHVG